jgi:hypothetical protein
VQENIGKTIKLNYFTINEIIWTQNKRKPLRFEE